MIFRCFIEVQPSGIRIKSNQLFWSKITKGEKIKAQFSIFIETLHEIHTFSFLLKVFFKGIDIL